MLEKFIPDVKKDTKKESQELVTEIQKLLERFKITKNDMEQVGINEEELEYAIAPAFLGKCLHFLMTISITRTLMLWPFMKRGGIKLNEQGTEENRQAVLAESFEETASASTSSDETGIELEEDIESIKNNESNVPEKRQPFSRPVFTFFALLFEDKKTLKRIAAINTFHDTIETVTHSVWNVFLSSLILNGAINYIRDPATRDSSDLLDVFGITGLRNILCIRSAEFIERSLLCSEKYKKNYIDILSSSLSSYYVWPFVAGIPLVFGVINALYASSNMNTLDEKEIRTLIQQLKGYKPGFLADGLGWIITAVIPDLFPPAMMLFMLPQPAIKQVLEKIKYTIIWDGRLSVYDRKALFNELHQFAQQRSQLTQMKALAMLADISSGIQFKNVLLLNKEGIDKEALKTLMFIKTKALKELRDLSNHYNLPDAPKSRFRPLFRYLYVNYLLWGLGYPQQHFLQPLFFLIKSIKGYYTLMFYKAILGGFITIINQKICEDSGQDWRWHKEFDQYFCSVCGDLPVPFNAIFNEETCLQAYLNIPRTSGEIEKNIIHRTGKQNLAGVNYAFNWSKVTSLNLFTYNNFIALSDVLALLKPKLLTIQALYINKAFTVNDLEKCDDHRFLTDEAGKALAQFIQNPSISRLSIRCANLSMETCITGDLAPIKNSGFFEIINALTNSSIKYLDLHFSHKGFINPSCNEFIANKIRDSELRHLSLPTNVNDTITMIGSISKILNSSHLDSFSIIEESYPYSSFDLTTCDALASNLPGSSLRYLSIERYINTSLCATSLVNNLILHAKTKTVAGLSFVLRGEDVVDTFSNLFVIPSLTELNLSIYFVHNISAHFMNALSNASLNRFNLFLCLGVNSTLNFTDFFPQLAKAVRQSNITNFSLKIEEACSRVDDSAFNALISYLLPLSQLKSVMMSGLFQITHQSLIDFAQSLAHSSIEVLRLFHNTKYLNVTFQPIIESLPNSCIKKLHLNEMTVNETKALGRILSQSKIEEIILAHEGKECPDNGDMGIVDLVKGAINSTLKYLLIHEGYKPAPLNDHCFTDEDAKNISRILIPPQKPGLWISRSLKNLSLFQNPLSKIEILHLDYNNESFGDEGALALCDMLPYTAISPHGLAIPFFSEGFRINKSIYEHCGVISGTSSLSIPWPYSVLPCLYQVVQQFIDTVLFEYPKAVRCEDSTQLKSTGEGIDFVEIVPADIQSLSRIDVASGQNREPVIINRDPNSALVMCCNYRDAIEAQREVFHSPHQSILYPNLLVICETFLNSVSKSALLTAVPAFVAEILCQLGGHEREAAEQCGQDIQTLLILSASNSLEGIAASFLAGWLVSRVTDSRKMISTARLIASIMTSVTTHFLTTEVSSVGIVLQTATAFMGSLLGSYGVNWGLNNANKAKDYLSNKVSFWSPISPQNAKHRENNSKQFQAGVESSDARDDNSQRVRLKTL